MINSKKMDEKDFVFINKPLKIEEEMAFSTFLKERKVRLKIAQSKTNASPKRVQA